jgi:hypothetical protein
LAKPREEGRKVHSRKEEPTVHPPSNTVLVLLSLFGSLLISSIVYLFIHPLLIIPSWFIALLVIYPVGEFILEYDRKKIRRTALYRFWIAAAKVTTVTLILLLLVDLLFLDTYGDLAILFLIGYGCQTLAASLVLCFMVQTRWI